MSIELYNKLKEAGNLSAAELEQLREKLGISVYAELENFLTNVDQDELFDYITILVNSIQMNQTGTNIALDYSDNEPLESFVKEFGIYDLNPNRLRTILVKLPLRPQRAKKVTPSEVVPIPQPVVEQTPLHVEENEEIETNAVAKVDAIPTDVPF